VDSQAAGHYIALVVRLQPSADGRWTIQVDGTSAVAALPLAPATLVVRLWHTPATGVLRGRVELQGTEAWAPIQSNAQLVALVRAWLMSDEASPAEHERREL
jgi:hypothetical protein